MSVSYTVSPAKKLVIVTATGVVGREDMDQLRAQLLADSGISGDMHLLLEAKEAESQLTFTDLQEIAARLQGIFDKGIRRVAVVTDSNFIHSLAKTFRVFAEAQPVHVMGFRETSDAVDWLGSAA